MSDEEDSPNNRYGFGIVLNVFGSIIYAIGWMLQKKTHLHEQVEIECSKIEDLEEDDNIDNSITHVSLSYLRSCKWWTGYTLYGFGATITSISVTFAPISLLTPLESLSIVFNAILGERFLDEVLYRKDIIGIILIILALTVAVLSGPKGTEQDFDRNRHDFEQLFSETLFIIFVSIYSFIIAINHLIIKLIFNKLSDTFIMISYCNISAYFGSWNLLATKCYFELLEISFSNSNHAKDIFSNYLIYILFCVWVITTISLEYWRQKALALYISTYVMATYRVFVSAGSIGFGAFYFLDFEHSTMTEIIIFILSICIAMLGICIIALKLDDEGHLEDRKTRISNKLKSEFYDSMRVKLTITSHSKYVDSHTL